MSLRITALIYMACFAALAMGLYLVKYSVQGVQRDVATLKQQLANEKESLHLLNAEWAYLNRPDRLRQLADRHLDLVPLDSRQIDEIKAIPAAVTEDEQAVPNRMVQSANQLVEAR
jgi:hypothetical protein